MQWSRTGVLGEIAPVGRERQVTENGPQVTDRAPVEIAIACYPGAQETCIYGLTDLFTYALLLTKH